MIRALVLPRLPVARNHAVLLGIAAMAWFVLLTEGAGWMPPLACLSPIADAPSRYWGEWRAFSESPFFAGTLAAWALMFAAMMTPLLAGPLTSVAAQSFAHRRTEATMLFLAGYVLVWGSALMVMLAALIGVRSLGLAHAGLIQPALLAAAAWWQGTRWKRAALIACHRPVSLSAFGRRATTDNLGYGARYALACIGSCWLMMLAMVFGHDFLPAAIAAAIVLFVERYARQPGVRFSQALLGLTAVAALIPVLVTR